MDESMDKVIQPYKQPHRGAGGNKKANAPPGFYTFQQAVEVTGINPSTLRYYIKTNRIKRHVDKWKRDLAIAQGKPEGGRTNGYYKKEDIDAIAAAHGVVYEPQPEKEAPMIELARAPLYKTEVRVARPEDEQGVVEVLTCRGWKTATAEQRIAWMSKNQYMDFIIRASLDGAWRVAGYIHCGFYTPLALADMMNGRKRGYDLTPEDIVEALPGNYDAYIGVATIPMGVNEDGSERTEPIFTFRLLHGFLQFLIDLARVERIFVKALYAVSDQPRGMALCERLGFVEYGTTPFYDNPGQVVHQYQLDLEKSEVPFARLYRAGFSQK